jgi:hypothetical protein
MPRKKQLGKRRLTRVSVKGEERDDIDWDRFAWALLQYARLLVEDGEASDL